MTDAPLAVLLEDDGAPAVLAVAPAAVMLADAGASQFLQELLRGAVIWIMILRGLSRLLY
jgi:hypothetical protein